MHTDRFKIKSRFKY